MPKGVQEKRTEVLENKVDRMWVMYFLNENMWSHPPVSGEGSAALRSQEIWPSMWFVTICWTLHITTSPHHTFIVLLIMQLTAKYQLNLQDVIHMNITKWTVVVLWHRTACYAWFVVMDNVQHTADLEQF